VAFVVSKTKATERLGNGALLALLSHKQEHTATARPVVDVALASGRTLGSGALAFPVEQRGAHVKRLALNRLLGSSGDLPAPGAAGGE
jgi:hypothetical protein